MSMTKHRIWQGKKEYAQTYYYCGQIWDSKRQLWRTVTDDFDDHRLAEIALLDYTTKKNNY